MANAHESTRHHMEEKPSEEFGGRERHDLHTVVVGVVPPAKPDEAVAVIDEPIIRQRDAVGVSTEIVEDVLGAGEGPLRIHNPVDTLEPTEEGGKGAGIGETGRAPRDRELAGFEGPVQAGEILRAKDRRKRPDRKQEGRATGDPAGPLLIQRSTGDEAVEMEMLRERLPPRVQNRGDPDGAAQMATVASEGEERVGRRTKEERVDHPWISLRQCVEIVRQGEDDVAIRNGQEIRLARREPAFFGERLALGAMTIATGVVRDPHGTAVVTRRPMPAQEGGAAGRDRPKRHVLHRCEAVGPTIPVAVRPHDVREFRSTKSARACRALQGAGTHGLSPAVESARDCRADPGAPPAWSAMPASDANTASSW